MLVYRLLDYQKFEKCKQKITYEINSFLENNINENT